MRASSKEHGVLLCVRESPRSQGALASVAAPEMSLNKLNLHSPRHKRLRGTWAVQEGAIAQIQTQASNGWIWDSVVTSNK